MQALAKFYPKLVDVEFCYNITLLAIIAKYGVLNREWSGSYYAML